MAKSILNLLMWHPEKKLSTCKITYIHRGSPYNLKTVPGSKIKKIEKGFLVLKEDIQIPYHRIIKIECPDKLIWKKCVSKSNS
ncbi:DUF504 domain-containing protein [Methanobacterium movens]